MASPTHPSLRKALVTLGFVGLVGYAWVRGQGGAVRGEVEPVPGGLRFQEVSAASGIQFVHRPTRIDPKVDGIAAQITATGAAVSVCDYNNDGWLDLYAVTSATGGQNALLSNRGDGTFEDVAERAGLADLNRVRTGASQGSVWGDFDNDGHDDVFVYKWGQGQLFRNGGDGTFRDVTAGSGLERRINSSAANWFDFDRDGVLDLFVTGYFAEEHDLWNLETTRIMQDSFEFSNNGGRNVLYRGLGNGKFEDISDAVGITGTRWTYASLAADFDGDGWQDLYVANDYGTEELFLNRNGQRLELAEDIGLEGESKSGMSASLGDLWDGERMAVYVTNISKSGFLFQGNNLRVNHLNQSGRMLQLDDQTAADCGWAWGAQFGDLDNDAWQDLVVVNGFISASEDRDYWYQMPKIGLATGDIVADAAQWPAIEDRSLSGYERTHVLLNRQRKGAAFREVGESVGINDRYDGRAVVLADLTGDGLLDVVVANQNGPLLFYRNATRSDTGWLEVRLEGHASGTNGYGAEVRLEHAGRKQLRVHTAASGFSAQNGPVVHFGLGPEAGPARVTVRWPSGAEQTFETLAPNQRHVIEEAQ